jgi:hypothetical protein
MGARSAELRTIRNAQLSGKARAGMTSTATDVRLEAEFEGLCPTSAPTPEVGNLIKGSKEKRFLVEINSSKPVGKIPGQTKSREKGALASAVLTNQESERFQWDLAWI